MVGVTTIDIIGEMAEIAMTAAITTDVAAAESSLN
jgi:hypothetical protein